VKRFGDTLAVSILAVAAAVNAVFVTGRAPAAPEPPRDTVRRATLLFAGDLMLHTPQLARSRTPDGGYDFSRMFEYVADRFREADYAVLNLETTLSKGGYSGYPCFRSPAALARSLADIGVDAVTTANNHCCDGGGSGIAATVEALDSCGIRHTGAFVDSLDRVRNNPLRFAAGGLSFALFSYTYGTNGIPVPSGRTVNLSDTAAMARDLDAVGREPADAVIVFMHWGVEYERRENESQRRMAGFLRRHGADLIIGSHPHVIQPAEIDSTHAVLYSLGNFVSNQQWRYSDGGLIARIAVSKSGRARPLYAVTLEPVWVMTPEYRIIPPDVGDTIAMPAAQRKRYDEFLSDTRALLDM